MLTDEDTTGSIIYTCFKMFNTATQSLCWQLSHSCPGGFGNFLRIWKTLFSAKYLPCMWAICQWGTFTFLLFLKANGNVTASPAAKTPGMLVCIICRGEQRWALVHTLHEQKLQSWSGPELPWSLRTQGKLCLAVGPPGEISFSLLHLEMRTHMQGPTVSLGQWVIQ